MNRPTVEVVAASCYEAYCNMSGDQTMPGWDSLTVAQREIWRRVVTVAWGQDKPIKGDDSGGRLAEERYCFVVAGRAEGVTDDDLRAIVNGLRSAFDGREVHVTLHVKDSAERILAAQEVRCTHAAGLARLRALEQAATPGPWQFEALHPESAALKAIQAAGYQKQHIAYPSGISSYPDLEFCAAARSALGPLLACAEALEQTARFLHDNHETTMTDDDTLEACEATVCRRNVAALAALASGTPRKA